MKKFLLFFVIVVLSIGAAVAQPNNSDKSLWKSAKKAAKELKKQGWKTDGVEPLENLLYQHIKNYKAPGCKEMIGTVQGGTNITTLNQAKQWSYNMVAMSYAKQAGGILRGRIDGESGGALKNVDLAADNFYEAYEMAVQKEIKGEITYDFGIYKEKKDNTLDFRGYYILNEDGAAAARLRALDNAVKESDAARRNAEKISEFVRQGFEINE